MVAPIAGNNIIEPETLAMDGRFASEIRTKEQRCSAHSGFAQRVALGYKSLFS